MGYYVYSETSWRFPFQKIRTLFVGIWTEHRILIGTRRVLNLVIEWEGTGLAPTYVHTCTKQTAFEENFSHFSSRLDVQVSRKMISLHSPSSSAQPRANWLQKFKYSGYCILISSLFLFSWLWARNYLLLWLFFLLHIHVVSPGCP